MPLERERTLVLKWAPALKRGLPVPGREVPQQVPGLTWGLGCAPVPACAVRGLEYAPVQVYERARVSELEFALAQALG